MKTQVKTLYVSVEFIWQSPERRPRGETGPPQTGSENRWLRSRRGVTADCTPRALGSFSVSSSSVAGMKPGAFSYFVLSTL